MTYFRFCPRKAAGCMAQQWHHLAHPFDSSEYCRIYDLERHAFCSQTAPLLQSLSTTPRKRIETCYAQQNSRDWCNSSTSIKNSRKKKRNAFISIFQDYAIFLCS